MGGAHKRGNYRAHLSPRKLVSRVTLVVTMRNFRQVAGQTHPIRMFSQSQTSFDCMYCSTMKPFQDGLGSEVYQGTPGASLNPLRVKTAAIYQRDRV